MRGHRYAGDVVTGRRHPSTTGATFTFEQRRHFSTPDPPAPASTGAAPRKTDAQIQEEQRQARLGAQRRRGRRATMLTKGDELGGETQAASLGAPGQGTTIG